MFSADYNVLNESAEGEKWMLIDAVGGMFDDGYNYFLKHRASGQVDADGKAQSTVLGAVNIKGEHDAFSFKVSGGSKDVDLAPFYDICESAPSRKQAQHPSRLRKVHDCPLLCSRGS